MHRYGASPAPNGAFSGKALTFAHELEQKPRPEAIGMVLASFTVRKRNTQRGRVMRLPSLKYLRTFQMAGRYLSFKDAAAELSITPSAVSHQIRNLEAFLGIPLFVRKTRALEFTDAGRNYFQFLDELFSRLENETQQLKTQYGRSIVRLCVPPFFASEALLPRMSRYQAAAPDTDIRVSTQPSAMKVHPPEADLSILLGPGNWPDLVTYPLMARRVVTACSPALYASEKLDSYASLNGQTLIVHESRPDAWEEWAAALNIVAPRRALSVVV
jgi:LysR family glycine cleavage system transcriptional activator